MSSIRIGVIRGTSKPFEIELVDEDGEALTDDILTGASAAFDLRNTPDGSNVLGFTTVANPSSLYFSGSSLTLAFVDADTDALPIVPYVWRLVLTKANLETLDLVEWSPFDLTEGGVTAPTPPTFTNTVMVDHNYGLSDALRYMTPGGSPIADAQIRIYYKSDYDLHHLDAPVGISQTNAYGRWQLPILVIPGFDYVVQFFLPNQFGPDVANITA